MSVDGERGAGLTSNLEEDYRRVVEGEIRSRFLPGTSIEIIRDVPRGVPFRHVVFDFDGTLSLVREGWPEVMVPMMVGELQKTGTPETPDRLFRLCHDFVMRLNGKQTIYQMIQLAEEIRKRGGKAEEPIVYKERYHVLLMERISERRESLRSGRTRPEDFLVPGTFQILSGLRDAGLRVYLASGTDERFVVEEAELLGLIPYFGRHVYGAIDDYRNFSKKMVIERILRDNRVEGAALLGFGDGYVEIENVKGVGGTAIAVASDEAHRSGRPDPWKRDRLIGVGADVVIPDFSEYAPLLEYLLRQE